MKILLANPSCKTKFSKKYEKYFIRSGSRWPHSGVKFNGWPPHYLPFPFFLAYAAGLLLQEGFKVEVIDGVALDYNDEQFLSKINQIRPDIFFMEVTTATIKHDLEIVKDINKRQRVPIILAGTHASVYAAALLKDFSFIDYVIKGEYEFTLVELIKRISKGQDLIGLKGVVFRRENEIIDTGFSTLVDPLDKLPLPARHLFPSNDSPDINRYWDGFCQCWPAIQMQASRGCPYRCYFCAWNQIMYNNGKYRIFSVKRVVDEIEEVKNKFKAKEIYFDDDSFTIDKVHVLSICDEIIKRKLKIKWSCMGDAINLDEEMLKKMVESGCVGIKFGVESGSPKILEKLGKPLNLERVKEIVGLCLKYKIKSHASFTLGLLDETKEDAEKTIKFAQNLNVDSMQISIATPFPGTMFFNNVEERGFLISKDWKLFDGKVSELISYPDLNCTDIEKYRQRGWRIWFLKKLISPGKIMRQFNIFLITLKSLGIRIFFVKLFSVIIDDLKNK